jgi:hypothetical protein
VRDCFGGVFTLEQAGFEDQGEFLVLGAVDQPFLRDCLALLERYAQEAAQFQ